MVSWIGRLIGSWIHLGLCLATLRKDQEFPFSPFLGGKGGSGYPDSLQHFRIGRRILEYVRIVTVSLATTIVFTLYIVDKLVASFVHSLFFYRNKYNYYLIARRFSDK